MGTLSQPLMRAAKSLFYCYRRDPAELAADLFNVDDTTADVVDVAAIDISRFEARSRDLQNYAGELIDGRLAASADVVDLPIGLGHESRQQGSFYGVVNKSEVAGLLAVAVNARRFAGGRRFEELRHDSTVGIVGPLARSINVRIAHDCSRQSIALVERLAVILTRKLRH